MNIGTGGANISLENLAAALRGAQVWNVNSNIGRYVKNNYFDSVIALRAQYGFGDSTQRGQLWDILNGRTGIWTNAGGDLSAETTIVDGRRMINLSGYLQRMSKEEQMRLAVLLGHEAYRDGIVTGDNNLETRIATLAHTEMALRMLFDDQQLAFDDNLIRDIIAYMGGTDFFNAYVDNYYDSSADFWKLMRDGTIKNDNSGWLTYEDGKPVLNVNGEQIGAAGIETGLLNILFGGTHNVGYNEYSDAQIRFVQNLMLSAGMNYTEGENGDLRSRLWGGNETGQSLNMQQIMQIAGNIVASPVFALYYEDNAISFIAQSLGKDIGNIDYNSIPYNAISRYYSELLPTIMSYFQETRHFFDNPEEYNVTGKHDNRDPKYLYTNYENDAHFGTDFSNQRSGGSIYLGISGKVIKTDAESEPGVGNGNWMAVEYGYMFGGSFISSGIYGEYMHMERWPNFIINSYLNSNQLIGTIGSTGNSDGAHLHYSIYTLDNYPFSQTTLRMLLNNNISQTVVSRNTGWYAGTYNGRIAKKVTYDIENFLRGLR
jgi:murein DD-endopeptidase MepM/ murein hydrolase activator NlpD